MVTPNLCIGILLQNYTEYSIQIPLEGFSSESSQMCLLEHDPFQNLQSPVIHIGRPAGDTELLVKIYHHDNNKIRIFYVEPCDQVNLLNPENLPSTLIKSHISYSSAAMMPVINFSMHSEHLKVSRAINTWCRWNGS